MKNMNYCCIKMKESIAGYIGPVFYLKKYREYFFFQRKSDVVIYEINYCPRCGKKFPLSLRSIYFYILEKEYGINEIEAENEDILPEEFKSDEWWEKRKL